MTEATNLPRALNKGWFTAIFVFGILIFALSGLCTGLLAVASLIGPDPYHFWQVALKTGTPIIIASGFIAWFGWRGRRRHQQREDQEINSADTASTSQ